MTFLFITREEVPRLTVTWTRDLERRHTARQVEPGGTEAMWREGSNFLSKWIAIGCCEVHPAATPLSNWRRPRAAQWAPIEDCKSSSILITFTFLLCSFHFSFLFYDFAIICQCLTRIRTNWKCSPCSNQHQVVGAFYLQFKKYTNIIMRKTANYRVIRLSR